MHSTVLRSAVFALLVPAAAQATPRAGRGHTVAISISPIHLAMPLLEVQGELYISPTLSVAGIAGAGTITAKDSLDKEVSFSVIEIGGQVRTYFYGTTEGGAYAGGELLWVQLSGETDGISGLGAGLSLGGMAGYKWTWDNFFIDLAGGVAYVKATGTASSGSETATAEDSAVGPLINANLGWAF